MGKSKKKKKQRDADFRKVKLKVGKKLKKAQDTDTSFQSRKVLLQDQLRKYHDETSDAQLPHVGQAPNQKKQPISELCYSLKHHNKNVRKENLLALKLRLASNSELLCSNLLMVLSALGPLLHDDEPTVRQSLLPIVNLITDSVSAQEMEPHFQLLVAHLVCALTKLDSSAKLFALNCLEKLFKCYPELCKNSTDLFNSFLDFLETISGKSVTGFLVSDKDKLYLVKQLSLFIAVMIPKSVENDCQMSGKVLKVDLDCEDKLEICLIPQNSSAPFDFPLLYPDILSSDQAILENPESMQKCFEKSLAFLHNIWLELKTKNGLVKISQEDSDTVRLVLETEIAVTKQAILLAEKRQGSAEQLGAKCREILRKKAFVKSYSVIYPLKDRQSGHLNKLLDEFLNLCRPFLSPEAAEKWLGKSKIKRKNENFRGGMFSRIVEKKRI